MKTIKLYFNRWQITAICAIVTGFTFWCYTFFPLVILHALAEGDEPLPKPVILFPISMFFLSAVVNLTINILGFKKVRRWVPRRLKPLTPLEWIGL